MYLSVHFRLLLLLPIFLLLGCNVSKKIIEEVELADVSVKVADTIRFASYNVSMFRNSEGALENELINPISPQVQRVAAVIQQVRPDVIALMEFDFDKDSKALASFKHNFLKSLKTEAIPSSTNMLVRLFQTRVS